MRAAGPLAANTLHGASCVCNTIAEVLDGVAEQIPLQLGLWAVGWASGGSSVLSYMANAFVDVTRLTTECLKQEQLPAK